MDKDIYMDYELTLPIDLMWIANNCCFCYSWLVVLEK